MDKFERAMAKFDKDMAKFDKDMEKFDKDMAKLERLDVPDIDVTSTWSGGAASGLPVLQVVSFISIYSSKIIRSIDLQVDTRKKRGWNQWLLPRFSPSPVRATTAFMI